MPEPREPSRPEATDDEGTVDGLRDQQPSRDAEQRVAGVASRQKGAVSHAQLLACGLTATEVRDRVRRGVLHRVHRGVFIVGHLALAPFALEAAALLACGPGAMLSHRSAGWLWRLLAAYDGPVEVTVPRERRPRRPGIIVHRPEQPPEAWTRQGLPVTSVARTLADLAAVLGPEDLAAAVNEALVRRLVRAGDLTAPRLRAVLDGTGPTRSEAERALVRLVRRARLPLPETNVRVAGFEVDLLWRAERVVVEVDGFTFHGDRAAFERDRRRDMALRAAGYTPVRVTPRQVEREPEAVLAHLAGMVVRREPLPDRLTA